MKISKEILEFILTEVIPANLNEYNTINHGGCGIFAAILSDNLTKLEVEHDIIVQTASYDEEGFNNINYFKQHNSAIPITGIGHAMIKIGNDCYDCNGVKMPSSLNTSVSRHELQILIDNPSIWNSEFDRGLVPEIKEKIDRIFDLFKNIRSEYITTVGENEIAS